MSKNPYEYCKEHKTISVKTPAGCPLCLQSRLTKAEEQIEAHHELWKTQQAGRLNTALTTSEAENIEWQEQISELCIESASQGVKLEKSEAEVKTLTLFHEDAKKQIKTATDRWNDLREELKVCEECGNTTEIEGDNYLIWCKTCWEKVVADNKRLSAIYEDWKSMEGELAGVLLKLTTATDTIKRLRIAISGLLFSFNRHWIRMSLDDCRGTSPSEVAQSVVNAEQALKPEQEGIEPCQ